MSIAHILPDKAKPGQLTAMISSTALDLPEHRAAVRDACEDCGVFPIGMESLPARDASGIAVSLEMVDQADLYLGIYAWRYGWVPDGKDISVTEMEFDRAVERQKEGGLNELLIFTAHKKHPVTIDDIETGDVPQQKLAAFKSKAATGRVRKEFKSVEELRRLVGDALREFKQRRINESPEITDPEHFDKLRATPNSLDHQSSKHQWHELAPPAINAFLGKARVQKQEDFLIGLIAKEQFRRFNFVQENGKISVGAYLCFGDSPSSDFHGATTKCYHWKGLNRSSGFYDDVEARQGLIQQFEAALAFLKRSLALEREITEAGRSDVFEVPIDVLEEVIANALVHREYKNRNDSIMVSIYEDRIEVVSPGKLPPPLNLSDMNQLSTSHPRNPQIARIFYLSGFVERAGSGMERITSSLASRGLPPPHFDETADQCFKVTIQRPSKKAVMLISEPRKGALAPAVGQTPADVLAPFNLPGGYVGRLFLGREDFLDRLRASLPTQNHSGSQGNFVTSISGLGGIGKTHAAVEYAHRHRDDYSALLFVSGESPEKLSASLAALCGVLHLDAAGELPPDEATRVAVAVDWLASHRGWLLIVDNVDTEESAAALTGLLERLTTGHVLITSRLHDWADNVVSLDLSVLSPDAATDLLLQLTDKQRRKTPTDAAQARQLADLLEGLPLALHQAAGYIKEQRLTLADYLAIYEQEAADLLGWFKKHLIPYAGPEELGLRPVLVTWKTSFDKLDADTRFWLLVFAHFAPDPIPEFLLDSAPGANDEIKNRHRAAKRALAQAETYSLLTRDRDQPRFKLHRLVQHILRLTASEADRSPALAMGIQLFDDNHLGNPQDVRTWKQWTPLQPHAVSLVTHAPDTPAPERLSWLLGQLALLVETKSLYAQSEPFKRRALKLDEASHGPDHPLVAIHLNNLATLLQATNRLAEAEPLMRRALDIDEACYGPDHPDVAIDLNNLAQLLQATNRLAEAEPLMRRVVEIFEISYGQNHPQISAGLNNLATLLQATNRLAEAEPLMRRALGIDEASYGPDHPNVALRLNNLAMLLQDTNRLAEAEPLMRRALTIDEASYGPDHPNVATSLNNLAGLLKTTSRLAEAEPLMRRALGIDEASYGPDHPNVAKSLNNFATLLQATNRLAEAEPLMRRALGIDEASYGPDHPNVAIRLNNLATLLQATNRLAEAEPLIRRAFGIFVSSLGMEHPNSQGVGGNYIGLLHALEVPEEEIAERVRGVVSGAQ